MGRAPGFAGNRTTVAQGRMPGGYWKKVAAEIGWPHTPHYLQTEVNRFRKRPLWEPGPDSIIEIPREGVSDEHVTIGVEREDLRVAIGKALETLSEREREILHLRYGFHDGKTRTLKWLARFFCVCPERIRQVEAKAIRKLRHPIRARMIA